MGAVTQSGKDQLFNLPHPCGGGIQQDDGEVHGALTRQRIAGPREGIHHDFFVRGLGDERVRAGQVHQVVAIARAVTRMGIPARTLSSRNRN